MALSSLRYRSNADALTRSETKSGSYIYDGSVNNFHEWEFRTEMRMSAALSSVDAETGEPQTHVVTAAVNKVVEGLRGDAFDMAMDIGKDALLTPKGIDQLIAAIRASLFPIEAQEAKILFQVGQRPYGPLSRQNGESMVSYISRRRRWWKLVTKLDPKLVMSDDMLGSLLLDHAGLSPSENLMVLTSTGNVTTFDKIKDVLILQHGRIHIRQKGKGDSKGNGFYPSSWSPGKGYPSKSKGKGKTRYNRPPHAFHATDDDWYEEPYPEELSPYGYYASGYTPEYGWDDTAWTDAALMADGQVDDQTWDDEESYALWAPAQGESELNGDVFDEMVKAGYTEDEASEVIQENLVANLGTKGGRKGKGKGKGFNPTPWRAAPPPPKGGGKGAPTLEDRKKRLQEIKKRSRCKTCEEIGHWSGDPECKGKPRTGFVAFTGERESFSCARKATTSSSRLQEPLPYHPPFIVILIVVTCRTRVRFPSALPSHPTPRSVSEHVLARGRIAMVIVA